MLNSARLRASATSRSSGLVKNKYGGGNDKFPWMNPSSFKEGSFKLRFLPRDPAKCPNGYHVYTKYRVEKEAGDDPVQVLAMESWAPDQDDFILDILECYEQVKEHLTLSVREAIEQMFPSKYFLFPCAVHAKIVEEPSSSGKMYKKLVADSSVPAIGIIFAVEQKGSDEPPLVKRLATLCDLYPTLSMEDEQGRYVNFTRTGQGMQTRYNMDALPEAEPLSNTDIFQDYPDFNKFGKNYKKDQYAMKSLLQSCWWWEPFSEFIDLD